MPRDDDCCPQTQARHGGATETKASRDQDADAQADVWSELPPDRVGWGEVKHREADCGGSNQGNPRWPEQPSQRV